MIVDQKQFCIKLKYKYIPICLLVLVFMWTIDSLLISLHNILTDTFSVNRKILTVSNYNCTLGPNICANGYCYNSTCICYPRYTTIYHENGLPYENTYCNYYQKSAYKACVLEATLGLFGAGYFYIEQLMFGLLQLIFTIILFCPLFCRICCMCMCGSQSQKDIDQCGKRLIFIVYCCSMTPLIFWWIYATIQIKNLNYRDGNNMSLYNDI